MSVVIETPAFRLEVSYQLCSLKSNTIDKYAPFAPNDFEGFLSAAAWVGIRQGTETFDSLVLKAIEAGAVRIEDYLKFANRPTV